MSVSPMKKIQIVAAALLLLAFAAPLPAQTDLGCRTMVPLAAAGRPKPAFADYAPAPGSSFWCALDKVTYQTALMTACNVASFCPQGPVTREAMAVSLLNGLFPSTVGAQQAPFPSAAGLFGDVPADYPLACWIEKLYQAGVTSGCAGSPAAGSSPVTAISTMESVLFRAAADSVLCFAQPVASSSRKISPSVMLRFMVRPPLLLYTHDTSLCVSKSPAICKGVVRMLFFTCLASSDDRLSTLVVGQ